MPVSPGWFAVAVQALVLLARADDEVCPSARLAGQVHSHAVFLRRVLAQLVRARIVEAREGREGGYRLARPADTITLADVYRAVKSGGPIDLSPLAPAGDGCGIGAGCRTALEHIVAETEESMLEVLGRHTIGQLIEREAVRSHAR